MTTKNFKTLHVQDTKYNADSIEWCPISPFKTSFVCGTYHLVTKSTDTASQSNCTYSRTGNILVFTVLKDKLELEHSLHCPAVLDLKWSCKKLNENIALAVANSEGEVCLYYFNDKKLNLISKSCLKKNESDLLTLSLDWVKDGSPDLICASDSKGNIYLIKIHNDALSVVKEWNAHSLESWIVCFDYFNSNILYSGGDDVKLKVWDLRCELPNRICSISKHTAGVTALNSNSFKEHNLISGSYDENVFFWDARNMKKPVGEINASGGVWRLKWEPKSRSKYVLAACIYGGFQIYDTKTFSIAAEYKEHESLAYGADWCYLNKNESENLLGSYDYNLIATCSFYDHKLRISMWNENSDF